MSPQQPCVDARPPAKPGAPDPDLLLAARDGDEDARREVVERFDPLVMRIAQRFHSPGGGDDLDDLIQVGRVGLLEAITRFEPGRGSFAAYAATTVSGTIKRHFRDRSWKVKIPRSLHDAALAVARARAELEGRVGRQPTDAELSEQTGLDLAQVVEARRVLSSGQPLSLQGSPDDGGEGPELGEMIGGEDPNFARAEMRGQISGMTGSLDLTYRQLLAMRFGLDRTQVEIAERLGCSQMQVSRLLQRALAEMERSADR